MDENILKEVDPSTLGIFWFTETTLKEIPEMFHTFDYLFEGMLTLHVNKEKANSPSHEASVFICKSFNRAIFLAHMENSAKPSLKYLGELIEISLAQSQNKENNDNQKFKILFINDSNVENLQKLKAKFPNIIFKKY